MKTTSPRLGLMLAAVFAAVLAAPLPALQATTPTPAPVRIEKAAGKTTITNKKKSKPAKKKPAKAVKPKATVTPAA